MANFSRPDVIRLLLLSMPLLMLSATSCSPKHSAVAEPIARAFGLDSYGQIDAIRYTFNLEIPGLISLSHTWEWEPKTGKVSYEGKDKEGKPVKVSYVRSELASQPDAVKNEVDPAFVNDNYWLIFPFHAYWDTSASVIDQGTFNLPIGSGTAKLVAVKYPADSGYTPGDTWDLYVGKDNRVVYFDYHRGGAKPPSRVFATWAGYKKAGPLLVSTEHRGTADGAPLHLTFTDVSVKLAGSDTWVKAQ